MTDTHELERLRERVKAQRYTLSVRDDELRKAKARVHDLENAIDRVIDMSEDEDREDDDPATLYDEALDILRGAVLGVPATSEDPKR